jgi:hypothetical protein
MTGIFFIVMWNYKGIGMPYFPLSQLPRPLAAVAVSDILIDHELCEIRRLLEEQSMQSEEQAHHVRREASTIAEPLPQHADAVPLVPTGTSVPRKRLTVRELARRRRQRLLELLQQSTKESVGQ